MADTPTKGVQKYLAINGVEMPTPSDYKYVEADFDSPDSARSETGILNRDRIRRGVLSPKFKWNALTTTELNKILKAIEPVWVQVTIFSPKATTVDHRVTFTGYAQATREASIVLPRYNSQETLWSFECSFIQQ